MKNKYFTAFLLCLFSFTFWCNENRAQTPNKKEELEAYKIGFITHRLNLSPDEAKSFWPVFNDFQTELETIRKKHKDDMANAKQNFETLSDKEIEQLVDGEIVFRQNELDIIKKFHSKFKKILKPRKLALFYKAQEDFKKELLNRIKDNNRK